MADVQINYIDLPNHWFNTKYYLSIFFAFSMAS